MLVTAVPVLVVLAGVASRTKFCGAGALVY